MRMSGPCLCHHSTEDLELGEWEKCGWGCGDKGILKLLWTRPGFVLGNEDKAATDYTGTMPGKRQGLGATGHCGSAQQCPQAGPQGLGEALQNGVRGRRWLQDFSSAVLDSVPKLFFPSLQNIYIYFFFLKWKTA